MTWHPDMLEELNPEVAAKAFTVIALHSAIDVQMMMLVTSCIGGEYHPAAKLIRDLAGLPGPRARVTEAIVLARFRHTDDWDLVERALARIRATAGQRRKLVHSCVGWVKGYDDVLMLYDPKKIVSDDAGLRYVMDLYGPTPKNAWSYPYHPDPRDPKQETGSADRDAEYLTMADLDQMAEGFKEAWVLASSLTALASTDEERNEKIRSGLARRLDL